METFFFYTFIAIVFLVIGGTAAFIGLAAYAGWTTPAPYDFRDESYGQLGIPELERLSGVQFGQEITGAFEAMKGDAQNIAERYIGYIESGFGSYEEAMASDLSDGVKDANENSQRVVQEPTLERIRSYGANVNNVQEPLEAHFDR